MASAEMAVSIAPEAPERMAVQTLGAADRDARDVLAQRAQMARASARSPMGVALACALT